MKTYGIILLASTILVLIFYYLFYWPLITRIIGIGALVLALIFSGALVSGDRYRSNTATDTNRKSLDFVYFIMIAIPFLVVAFF